MTKRDWQKDMEWAQLISDAGEYRAWTEPLIYWLQEAAAEKARADEMLAVLERIKKDVDQFRELTGFEAYESVEEQAAAFNQLVTDLNARADAAEAREQRLKEAWRKLYEIVDTNSTGHTHGADLNDWDIMRNEMDELLPDGPKAIEPTAIPSVSGGRSGFDKEGV